MLDDDERQVELALEVGEQVPERLGLALGDARGRLVEQQQVGCSATRQAISVMRRVPVDSSWIGLSR